MTQKKQDEQRARRNEDRSEEAHWQVAEVGAAEEVERLQETARHAANRQEEWESEGGALGPEA
jgi:hypothetical protein